MQSVGRKSDAGVPILTVEAVESITLLGILLSRSNDHTGIVAVTTARGFCKWPGRLPRSPHTTSSLPASARGALEQPFSPSAREPIPAARYRSASRRVLAASNGSAIGLAATIKLSETSEGGVGNDQEWVGATAILYSPAVRLSKEIRGGTKG